MSLTSYRAAPPRGGVGNGRGGLAATYSSAPWDAVPSALRVFTAEFGMGSGVLPLAMATRLSHGSGTGGRGPGLPGFRRPVSDEASRACLPAELGSAVLPAELGSGVEEGMSPSRRLVPGVGTGLSE